jgi:hypothetical protein
MGRFNRTLLSLMAIASIAAALYLFSTYRAVPLNEDGGFYLSISRDVLKGATPTVDVESSYTPGIYYTTAMVMELLGSQYSTILLIAYLVQIANTVLLYFILSRFIRNSAVKLFACLSYYYSHMLLEGWCFDLEPFQVFFILLAVLLHLSKIRTSYKLPLVGLCLGCSIMYKQYSLLALIAVCIVTWFELRRTFTGWSSFVRLLSVPFFAALPYLLFILLTKATFIGSLHSFGFLGNKAVLYASEGMTSWTGTLESIVIRMTHINWLFIPVITAAYLYRFHKTELRLNPLIPALFGVFLLPLFIRQYGHYYQLIAPWSYIIGAVVVDRISADENASRRFGSRFLPITSLAFFVILPLFLTLSPAFYAVPIPLIALTTSLFLLCAGLVIAGGLFLQRAAINTKRIVLIVMALVFLETLFLSLKLPIDVYRQKKAAQQLEATRANEVFPRGSKVYVIDYPQLYYICDFISPAGYYGFTLPKGRDKDVDWSNVNKLIIKGESRILLQKKLQELGYRLIAKMPDISLSFYSKNDN